MKNRTYFVASILVMMAIMIGMLVFCFTHRYTPIDQWSSGLVSEGINWAQVSKEYGTAASSYVIPLEEYSELLSLLETVTEKVSSRNEKTRGMEEGYRLVLYYEDKLWLFKCCENQNVSLMFEDAETGAIYGCEGSLLYISNPALWNYIIDTVEGRGTAG